MIFGQFMAGYLCKKIGRKGALLFANALYIPATVLSAVTKLCFPAFELLFLSRILWWGLFGYAVTELVHFFPFRSLACGISSVAATVWIVECAPPQIRGRMAAMQEVFMAIGKQNNAKERSSSKILEALFSKCAHLTNQAITCRLLEDICIWGPFVPQKMALMPS